MRPLRSAAMILASLAATAAIASAQDDPGRARLKAVADAYRALPAYVDEGRIEPAGAAPASPLTILHERPARLRLDAGIATLVSDGTNRLTLVRPSRMLLKDPAPARSSVNTIAEGPLGALALGGPAGRLGAILLALVLDDEAALGNAIGPNDKLTLEPRREGDPDGTEALVVNGTIRLLIDTRTHLIQRMELLGADSQPALTWNAGKIRTDPPAKDAFAMEIPEGIQPIAPLAGKEEQAEKPDAHPLLGKPAPQFTLNVLDGPDKTRRVTKDDLAGRVVLIDFWASWCGPCLRELPEIAALIAEYQARNAKLTVVALNMDRDTETRNGRVAAETTMKERELKLDVAPNGLVAIDPEITMAPVFEVKALPTVVLLDENGVVRAVHVGFHPDIRARLTKQIDALLEGNPLPDEAPAGEPRPKDDIKESGRETPSRGRR